MKITNFKPLLFVSASLLFWVFTIITLIAAVAVEEGTDGNSSIIQAIAKPYYIFRFPTHTLFFGFMDGPIFYYGLLFNSLFYGFLTERIVCLLRNRKLT
ncbi:hypothetical protein [Pedobacter sp. UBA5917]|jgi:hypothetical protein|uniref:hypothetical protein n=1 Tax=Pedobacter sp. UBA5917 TaxID=1947061 RepID=UPI0025D1C0ED|nr:hypothetical protein [Pedobacter sp. UBA5917]